jgi:hypothetical protein
LHNYLSRTGSVAHDVLLLNSNHFSCSDLPLFIPELQVEAVEPVESINTCARIIAAFFDAFLSDGASETIGWIPDELSRQTSIRRFSSNAVE